MDNDFYKQHLNELIDAGRYRRLRSISGMQGPEVVVDSRRAICMCSNNYLGLAGHPSLIEAHAKAAREYGVGSGASRLISGNMTLHEVLEKRIAAFKGVERALLFNSGYQANVGIITSLVGRGDYIYSDQLNHASIVDGARLSRAKVRVYHHCNTRELDQIIASEGGEGRKLIVSDSVFSMDGDLAPLKELVEIKKRYGAMLMIDEAHATGVVGPGGRGLAAARDLTNEIDITMGTLGKALGTFGAFAGASSQIIDYLINTARSFIFTTALPPPVVASAIAALDVIESQPELIARLQEASQYFRDGLRDIGYNIPDGATPIIPLVICDERKTMDCCEWLLDHGVFVQGIRPPTVQQGTSRLRITVMATHTQEHLDRALQTFQLLKEAFVL